MKPRDLFRSPTLVYILHEFLLHFQRSLLDSARPTTSSEDDWRFGYAESNAWVD